jgi:hypothetical protein
MSHVIDRLGKTYGNYTVIAEAPHRKNTRGKR